MEYTNYKRHVKKPVLLALAAIIFCLNLGIYAQVKDVLPSKLKTSLNAYSFNAPLSGGTMDLDDLIEYCAEEGFDAVDITAYYFPGYPEVPSDEYLYHIKREAFLAGLEISGTGVRNDFTDPDKNKRRESIQLVKDWIVAAEKLGAPVIRIFTGQNVPEGYTRGQVTEWLVRDIRECVEFGRRHGVVVAVQNHNDFIKNAAQVIDLMERVDSEWFGLILDVGSFREGDPYRQIERVIPFAVSWQIKEEIFANGEAERVDLVRLLAIIEDNGYRGYIPLETLGKGDPEIKVRRFLAELNEAMNKVLGD